MFLSPYTASSKADANHQEQNFGTCGHHLTQVECSAYGARVLETPGYQAPEEDSDSKPYGCYKIPATYPLTPEYNFNNNTNSGINCNDTNPCICKYSTMKPYTLFFYKKVSDASSTRLS